MNGWKMGLRLLTSSLSKKSGYKMRFGNVWSPEPLAVSWCFAKGANSWRSTKYPAKIEPVFRTEKQTLKGSKHTGKQCLLRNCFVSQQSTSDKLVHSMRLRLANPMS